MTRTETFFWGHVVRIDDADSCWLWIGYRDRGGYGIMNCASPPIRAHRYSFKLHRGRLRKDRFVCHKCDVRNCVRPSHLYQGTAKQNSADMVVRNRQNRKPLSAEAKLRMSQARRGKRATLAQYAHILDMAAKAKNRTSPLKGRKFGKRPQYAHKGESNANSKLTIIDVAAIRLDGRSQCLIAKDYGIAQTTVSAIKRGVIWR